MPAATVLLAVFDRAGLTGGPLVLDGVDVRLDELPPLATLLARTDRPLLAP